MRDHHTHTQSPLEAAIARLGPAAFHAPGVAIYQGDSRAILRELRGHPIRLTVTSPPYNIGKAYEKPRAINDYLAWCADWIAEIHRLTDPHGAFWLNLGYFELERRAKAIPIPYLLWDRVPFYLIQEIVWNYGAGVAGKTSFSPRNEKFLWYVKDPLRYTFNLDDVRDPNVKYPNQKKNGKLKCNPLGKNPTDVWQFPKVTSGTDRSSTERTPHPAQFPVAVIERIVKACSMAGDLVFDPFLGSGTVAEVALRCGRPVLGIEISDAYVDIARRRIELTIRAMKAAEAQGRLFALEQSQQL
jgi:adenine-specific DNA-methyltransferase